MYFGVFSVVNVFKRLYPIVSSYLVYYVNNKLRFLLEDTNFI